MRRRILFLLVALGVMLVAAQAATPRSAAQTFTDPSGDSGAAPDITTVVADNDTAGTITLAITTAHQADLAADGVLDIVFDTDRNPATGSSSGGEYRILIFGQTKSFVFLRWDGTQWADATAATLQIAHSPNTFRIVINKSDLGGVGAFDFYIVGVQVAADGSATARDDAPDGTAVWTYTLAGAAPPSTTTTTPPPPPPPPPPPTVGLGPVGLKAPGLHVGKLFSVRAHVTTTATAVRVTCVVKVSGRSVRAVGSYVRATHTATCTGRAPLTTVGKRLAGTMTVTISGDRDSRTFSFVIRA